MIIRYKIHHIVLLISFKNQYITIITAILYIFIQHNSYTCQEKFQKKFVFFHESETRQGMQMPNYGKMHIFQYRLK